MTPTGVEARICALIAERQQKGIAKYGTTVADNPLSRRAWLTHAMEEALDLAVYLMRAIDEIDATAKTKDALMLADLSCNKITVGKNTLWQCVGGHAEMGYGHTEALAKEDYKRRNGL